MKRMKPLFCTMLLGLTISDVVWANTSSPTWNEIGREIDHIMREDRDLHSSFKKSCEYLLPLYEQDNPAAIYWANNFIIGLKINNSDTFRYWRCPFTENKSLKQELLKVVERSDDIYLKKLSLMNLGNSFWNGDRTRKDIYQAKEFFGQACDLGKETACLIYKDALGCQKPSSESERSRCIRSGWDW